MEPLLISLTAVLSLANLLLLYFLGTYIVRMNEGNKQMLAELIDVLDRDRVLPQSVSDEVAGKSWDQKYEEELDAFARRMRYQSGLLDLGPPASTRSPDGLTGGEK